MKWSKRNSVKTLLLLGLLAMLIFTPLGNGVKGRVKGWIAYVTAKAKMQKQTPLESYTWDLEDTDFRAFDFESQKGKVVFINFWATWCGPCVAEMPSLEKLYHAYGDKVTFLFVAQDRPERVSQFLKRKGYGLPVYYSGAQRPEVLTSETLPTTYIIDREGRMVLVETNSVDWYRVEIRDMLDNLTAIQ